MPSRLRFLLLFLLPLAAAATAAAAELKIAVVADNPPFVSSEAGEPAGFDVELAHALCARMQAECAILPLAEDELLAALGSGSVDAVISLPMEEDYGQEVLLTDRYYKYGARFARKKGQAGKISYKGMAGKNVAVAQDTVFDAFLSEKFSGVNVRRYADIASARAALAAGEVEYLLDDRIAQLLWTRQEEGYEAAGPNYSAGKYFSGTAIAVRAAQLRDRLNSALAAMRKDGEYQKISKKHFRFDIYGR